jgi:lipoprotein-releasing system permease protein
MNFKYFIAKRFVFSKGESKFISFITYFSILGVTLGCAALIIAVSIMSGFELEIKSKVAGLVSHIQISSFVPQGLADYKASINKIKRNIPEVIGISPYVQKEAVIKYKQNVEGIILKGIVSETEVSSLKSKLTSGEFNLNSIDTTFSRIIIGEKLAKKMNIGLNNKVFVFGLNGVPSPVNQPKIKQFIVSGIYETGMKEYDDVIIYTDMNTAQKIFNFGDNASGIEILLNNIDLIEDINTQIKALVEYPYYPRSMFKIYKGLFSWVELQKAPTPIILGLIIIVAAFNIIGTLLMLVLEKTQSIGILKSLGTSNKEIMQIFISDGLLIGFIGVILGNIIGLGLCLLEMKYQFFSLPEQYYMKSVPILIQTENIILISAITISLVFLATLIPSFLASRFETVKSMKFS